MKANSKRVTNNIVYNLFSFVIILAIQFWFVPYIINNMTLAYGKETGLSAYGFVPLCNNFLSIMLILTLSFNSMVSRFFTVNILTDKKEEAMQYFNTSFTISFLFLAIFTPIFILLSYNINHFLNVPPNLLTEVRILFIFISFAFLTLTLKTPFETVFYCKNRLDIRSIYSALETLIRAIFLVLFFNLLKPSLWQFSAAYFIGTLFTFLFTVFSFKKMMPEIIVSFRKFTKSAFQTLLKSGVWQSLNYIGSILFLYIDMLVANKFLTAMDAGKYGAILQIPMLLRSMASSVSSVFGPVYVTYYSANDIKGLKEYTVRAQKLFGISISLIIGVMCGFGKSFLSIWLGKDFGALTPLLWLMISHLTINLAIMPLFDLITTTNKVKLPGMITPVLGVFNLAIAILFCTTLALGMYGIALANLVVLTLKNIIFIPIYCAHILKLPKLTFMKSLIYIFILFLFVFGISFGIANFVSVTSWFSLILFGGISFIISCTVAYLFALDKNEKQLFLDLVAKFVIKKKG